MKTYTLKYETSTAVVTGDLTFRSDGTVSYVWSCENIDWYRDGKFIKSSYGPVRDSLAKRQLDGFVLVKA